MGSPLSLSPADIEKAKPAEEKSHQGKWEQAERISKMAAQFAAAIGVVGGLLGASVLLMAAAGASGIQEIKGIPPSRFINLPTSLSEQIGQEISIVASLWFVFVLIIGAVAIAMAMILWNRVVRCFINPRKPNLTFFLLLPLACCLTWCLMLVFLGSSKELYVWLLIAPIITTTFYEFYKFTKDYSTLQTPKSLWAKLASKIAPTVSEICLVFAILYGFMCILILLLISTSVTSYIGRSAGWIQGVYDICNSPQIIFNSEKTLSILSDQKAFLLLRTDGEYYVFTTTVTSTPPSPPAGMESLGLLTSLKLTTGCSPANIIILPAASVGEVTLVYDEQTKPGPCCQSIPLSP